MLTNRSVPITRGGRFRLLSRVALVAALAGGLSPAADAQVAVGLEGGVTGGYVTNVAAQFPAVGPQIHAALGPAVGVSVAVPLGRLWALQSEALFVVKHTTADVFDEERRSRVTVDTQLRYVEFPVLVRVGAPRGLYGLAGPAFAWLARAPVRLDWGPPWSDAYAFEDTDARYRTYARGDVSVVLAAGWALRRVDVEARGDFGVADVSGPGLAQTHLPARRTQAGSVLARLRF